MMRALVSALGGDGPGAWTLPAFVTLASVIGLASMQLAPQRGQPVAALFPPWWSGARVMRAVIASDARILGFGTSTSMVVLAPLGRSERERLYGAGAWLVINPGGAAGCISGNRGARRP